MEDKRGGHGIYYINSAGPNSGSFCRIITFLEPYFLVLHPILILLTPPHSRSASQTLNKEADRQNNSSLSHPPPGGIQRQSLGDESSAKKNE